MIGLYGPEYLQFDDGGPAREVRIFVFLRGTKTKAVLYADALGLHTGPNPLWTDRRGELVFYVEEGEYDLYYEYPELQGTTVPIEVGPDTIPEPEPIAQGYVHVQSIPVPANQPVQIVHGLSFDPAGILALDNNGDQIDHDTVEYPGPGIVEIFYGVAFAGTIRLS